MQFFRHELPHRESSLEQFEHVREYMVEMIIQPNSELVRNSIQDTGLRHIHGLVLAKNSRFKLEGNRYSEIILSSSHHSERLGVVELQVGDSLFQY